MTERFSANQVEHPPTLPGATPTRRPLLAGILALLVVTVLAISAWPVRAAILLDYFVVRVSSDEVVLEWATLNEFNLDGFNIYCKEADEPPGAYHIIGTEVAQGGTDVGFLYTFPVTDLEPGKAYCFRIEEITTDGSAPELFDRCGYGFNITPTPTPQLTPGAGVVGNSPVLTPVDLVPNGAPLTDATATPVTLDAQQGQAPTATPFADSPLGDVLPTLDPNAGAASSQNDSPLGVPTTAGVVDPNATATPMQDGGTGATNMDNTLPGADAGLAQALPTPLYIVLTATPTAVGAADQVAAQAGLMPTLTPLPTSTPGSETLLAALGEFNTESILLATLCLVFAGGSGLGILGITSLGLYLRSRSDSRRSGPPSDRRYR